MLKLYTLTVDFKHARTIIDIINFHITVYMRGHSREARFLDESNRVSFDGISPIEKEYLLIVYRDFWYVVISKGLVSQDYPNAIARLG